MFLLMTGSLLPALGCSRPLLHPDNPVAQAVMPTDVKLLRYHMKEHIRDVVEFGRRLYAKNPCYEPDLERRRRKLTALSVNGPPPDGCPGDLPSHEMLTLAFAPGPEPGNNDRVWLLCRGLQRSINEAYGTDDDGPLVSSLEVPPGRLERLHHNLGQVNWRLKTYRDDDGRLFLRTNEAGGEGYINMGYEVIVTRMQTRITDDIFLRGGSPPKLLFDVSTVFLAILL
ncbi:MAG: hypothetical protein JW781_06520 [Deltaproteobacteria bacterium]|nr:hypothetical protein [Candidatus Anaeroferrophillacea bacterium]